MLAASFEGLCDARSTLPVKLIISNFNVVNTYLLKRNTKQLVLAAHTKQLVVQ